MRYWFCHCCLPDIVITVYQKLILRIYDKGTLKFYRVAKKYGLNYFSFQGQTKAIDDTDAATMSL